MKTFSTTELRRRTNRILDAAQSEPVMITWYGEPRFVLLSFDYFQALKKKLDCKNNHKVRKSF